MELLIERSGHHINCSERPDCKRFNCLLSDHEKRSPAYKAENTNISSYTKDKRLRIINYLDNDFYLILRIGELKDLRWDDISGDYLHIQRFVNNKNEIIDDFKGHTSEGRCYMLLTQKAKDILAQIHSINPNSKYIFIGSGQPLATVTFNRHLKKCCETLGIEYRSSHKLRFSTASIMYKNGVEGTELQRLLGHTSLSMTHHYLRNRTSQEETASKMRAILD